MDISFRKLGFAQQLVKRSLNPAKYPDNGVSFPSNVCQPLYDNFGTIADYEKGPSVARINSITDKRLPPVYADSFRVTSTGEGSDADIEGYFMYTDDPKPCSNKPSFFVKHGQVKDFLDNVKQSKPNDFDFWETVKFEGSEQYEISHIRVVFKYVSDTIIHKMYTVDGHPNPAPTGYINVRGLGNIRMYELHEETKQEKGLVSAEKVRTITQLRNRKDKSYSEESVKTLLPDGSDEPQVVGMGNTQDNIIQPVQQANINQLQRTQVVPIQPSSGLRGQRIGQFVGGVGAPPLQFNPIPNNVNNQANVQQGQFQENLNRKLLLGMNLPGDQARTLYHFLNDKELQDKPDLVVPHNPSFYDRLIIQNCLREDPRATTVNCQKSFDRLQNYLDKFNPADYNDLRTDYLNRVLNQNAMKNLVAPPPQVQPVQGLGQTGMNNMFVPHPQFQPVQGQNPRQTKQNSNIILQQNNKAGSQFESGLKDLLNNKNPLNGEFEKKNKDNQMDMEELNEANLAAQVQKNAQQGQGNEANNLDRMENIKDRPYDGFDMGSHKMRLRRRRRRV